jgi:hypothetical protein
VEEKRESERIRREKMIEQRKKRFYSQMKSDQLPTPGANVIKLLTAITYQLLFLAGLSRLV